MGCPSGYEPKTLTDGTKTCAPCKFGHYRKGNGGENDFCEQCRKDQLTILTGNFKSSFCISEYRHRRTDKALIL